MGLKPRKKRRKPDWVSVDTAKIHQVTPRYVNEIRSGTKNNEQILTTVMDLIEGHEKLVNKLIEEVKRVVPIQDKHPPKRKPGKLGDYET
jgi:hypothetical protein